jgi:hypothetical protein
MTNLFIIALWLHEETEWSLMKKEMLCALMLDGVG